MQSSAAPAELLYIGVIGGVIGVLSAVLNWISMWRNRRRIQFRVISAARYHQQWTQWDLEQVEYGIYPPGDKPIPKGWLLAASFHGSGVRRQE